MLVWFTPRCAKYQTEGLNPKLLQENQAGFTESPGEAVGRVFAQFGLGFEKIDRAEIYRLHSKVVWVDYSDERKENPGTFFHGTPKPIFDEYYRKYPDSFFIIFLEAFSDRIETLVVPAERFHGMFHEKRTDDLSE